MKKIFLIGTGLLLIAILAGCGRFNIFSRQTPAAEPAASELGQNGETALLKKKPASAPIKPVVSTQTIIMTSTGFSPSSLTIAKGTIVKFVNQDTRPRWPASGVHPAHLVCRGFDSSGSIKPGASYSFTFKEAKKCPMHDHLDPSLRGSITVQ